MDAHIEMILEQYQENLETLNLISTILKEKLLGYVKEFKSIVNSVETRVKTYDSLKGKLELKGYKYNSLEDITDLVGGRVVTFYSDEVDKFAASIEQNFDIDWDNSIDKRKIYNIDQFGYMSLHYIVRIPKAMYYNPDFPKVNDFRIEIQLRSNLQHTWATIHHDTGYKNDVEIPKVYLRSLNRLAGLLELADESFCEIKNEIEDYRRRMKTILKEGHLEDIELNIDSFNAFIENGGFSMLNNKIATINNMEIEEVSLRNFLVVFKAFGFTTLKDLDTFMNEYLIQAYEFCVRQFANTDIDIISSATGPLALCVVYIVSRDMGEQVIKKLLDALYGERKSNERQAARLMKIAVSMGLVKGVKE